MSKLSEFPAMLRNQEDHREDHVEEGQPPAEGRNRARARNRASGLAFAFLTPKASLEL